MQSDWTLHKIELAARLYREGLSCSHIAREINKLGGGRHSRNAVIGKLHRLGLAVRASGIAASVEHKPVRAEAPSTPGAHKPSAKIHVVRHVTRTAPAADKPSGRGQADASQIALNGPNWAARASMVANATPGLAAFTPTADDLLTARPFAERTLDQCKWPFGDGEQTLSCCRPVERGGYCQAHAKRAFVGDGAQARSVLKGMARDLRRYG